MRISPTLHANLSLQAMHAYAVVNKKGICSHPSPPNQPPIKPPATSIHDIAQLTNGNKVELWRKKRPQNGEVAI